MIEFKQYNSVTQELYTVVVVSRGYWTAFLQPTRRLKFIGSLEEFQEFFKCSDEDLAIIKLKYGSPNPGESVRGQYTR